MSDIKATIVGDNIDKINSNPISGGDSARRSYSGESNTGAGVGATAATSNTSQPGGSASPSQQIFDTTTSLTSPKTFDPYSTASGIGGDHGAPVSQSTVSDLIANKQRLLQQENIRRVMNPPKLERKHSSGDLHSRLKTRKILGVGETDNGDIHRSKISQVLGHNEHLYVKFPRGIWNWQAFLSAMLFVQAALILFFPRQACQLKLLGIQQPHEKDGLMMASKYYAVSLFALSFICWRFMFIRDKTVVRTVLLAALIYSSSVCAIDLVSALVTEFSQLYDLTFVSVLGFRLGTALISSLYISRLGNATSGLRKSPSHKDLIESFKKDG